MPHLSNSGEGSMNAARPKPALDRPTVYETEVPGELDESWTDWDGNLDSRRRKRVLVKIIGE